MNHNIFHMYVPKCYLNDFVKFKDNVDKPSRVICEMIKQFNTKHITFDLPTIRSELEKRGYEIVKRV